MIEYKLTTYRIYNKVFKLGYLDIERYTLSGAINAIKSKFRCDPDKVEMFDLTKKSFVSVA